MATIDEELVRAVQENDIKHVKTLLNKEVSPNFLDTMPMKLAIAAGNTKLAILMMERHSIISASNKYELFEQALIKKQPTVVARLLKLKVNANMPLSFGDSPLSFATELGSSELVKVLLDGDASPNSVNARKEPALYIACRDGSSDIAIMLINCGADITWVHANDYNFTPLIVAVANDNIEIVQRLVNYNVKIDAQDTDGCTALWHAYSNCNEEICALLLKAGAKADIPNKQNKTVIEEANEEEEENFIRLVKKYSTTSMSLTKADIPNKQKKTVIAETNEEEEEKENFIRLVTKVFKNQHASYSWMK